ncbi:MAG TPA: GNAT family protein [Thermomicrobiales bacterium]|nr:GNAT family protein [Thermomicrobiales bacterium]
MTHPWWPLFDLRVTNGPLTLRAMTEADLAKLAASLPDDLEQNPAAARYPNLDNRVNRGVVVHQEYWSAWGNWSVDAWRLPFVTIHDGTVIGSQTLEGTDFVRLRVVDTASYLVPEARGRGYGKAMRRAVLALAFGELGAEMAITSAWHDNHASLGVSRALGYESNGISMHVHDDRVDRMEHLRLMRSDWLASGQAEGIVTEGFGACRPLFGLAESPVQ